MGIAMGGGFADDGRKVFHRKDPMMKLRILVLAAAGLLAACGAVWGEEGTRVAVADMEKVFTNHPTTVAVEAKLKEGLAELESDMKEMIAEGRAIEEEAKTLQADARNELLSEEARREKKLAYAEKVEESRDFQAKVKRTYELRMKQLQDDVMRRKEEIVEDLMAEVAAFAERSGYDLILDKSGLTANNIPLTVFFSPDLDVTEPLVQWIKEHGGEESGAEEAPADGGAED